MAEKKELMTLRVDSEGMVFGRTPGGDEYAVKGVVQSSWTSSAAGGKPTGAVLIELLDCYVDVDITKRAR